MIAQRRSVSRRRRFAAARAQGFSLMELMIVVAITGVLAAIAIPTFIDYVLKARTSEAPQFLGVIKLKQESYRAEFGGYLACNGKKEIGDLTGDQFAPGDKSKMNDSVTLPLSSGAASTVACFDSLGAKPDGYVRFGYGWISGTPTDLASSDVKDELNIPAGSYDHYFVTHAVTDLDGDGVAVLFELSNFTKNIYIMNEDGSPSEKGWE